MLRTREAFETTGQLCATFWLVRWFVLCHTFHVARVSFFYAFPSY